MASEESHNVAEKRMWYRGSLFNAFVIGSVGFLAPGLWNAMNALGAGGAQSPFLVNAANALVFGLRLYTNNRFVRLQDLNIWLIFRTGGPLIGGAIVLALNNGENQKGKGKVGPKIYLIFIALQCVAAPIALLLTPPEKVQRSDNTKVKIVHQKSLAAELRALWRAVSRRDIVLLLPVFWAAYFNQYSGNFETYYFGVRARALIGFVGNFATLLASQLISLFLDYKRLPVNNISELSRFTGILRGQESFSQAVSFGLNTRDWRGGRVPLAINTILLGLAVVPTWIAVREHIPVEPDKDYGFGAQANEETYSEGLAEKNKITSIKSKVQV
ncbi:hypothetical protein B7494_g6881 [Chlorociboria aeruginascens]|nr:hypothetical protein B7494_g6881 [Chlorociboria aeruginascens]